MLLRKIYRYFFPTLDRYLIREFIGPFLLAVGGFAIVAIVDILFYMVELAVVSGVSFYTVLRMLLYKLPAVMILFFPMSVLFAVMLMLVRMAKDNELTVLRAAGVSVIRVARTVILLAVFTSGISYITNERIVPWANKISDDMISREIQRTPPPEIVENIVFKDAWNRFYYIKKVNARQNKMEGILIFEETASFPRILTAHEAQWNNKSWLLRDGYVQDFNEGGQIDFVDHFQEMTINVDQELQDYYRQKTAQQMDSQELQEKIQIMGKGGMSTRALQVEYYMKQSLPITCLVFGLMGVAFCFGFVRSGKDWWGVIIAICVVVLAVGFYFFIMALFRAMAKDGKITPLLGAWLPNMVYGGLSFVAVVYHGIRR